MVTIETGSSNMLESPRDWPEWYAELKWHAWALGLWKECNPDLPGIEEEDAEPVAPTYDAALEKLRKQRAAEHDDSKGEVPEPSLEEVDALYDRMREDYIMLATFRQNEIMRRLALINWISRSVSRPLLNAARIAIWDKKLGSNRALIL
ncbi:b5ccfaec-29a4-4935-8f72-63b120945e0d [Thermothielavioides terrestris]|uniref:B5ccfaec-29a4-4935-8f72-63b120945e0d n=1 Tax=Thermothielavioides terrestris TaxID=2587410 RepID=A0A446B6V5_9PEZI|nr:b5ccfaec-29a4-4935-8f72-63b120945e0d [Thermothielavioides terrestris]